MNELKINIEEAKEVFFLFEELNDFFHNSENYTDKKKLEAFIARTYPLISKGYYETIWNWLPSKVQESITSR